MSFLFLLPSHMYVCDPWKMSNKVLRCVSCALSVQLSSITDEIKMSLPLQFITWRMCCLGRKKKWLLWNTKKKTSIRIHLRKVCKKKLKFFLAEIKKNGMTTRPTCQVRILKWINGCRNTYDSLIFEGNY